MYSLGDTTRSGGLPHSEIVGSKLIRSSPTLIAAYHVLHRLLEPRHSQDALTKTLESKSRAEINPQCVRTRIQQSCYTITCFDKSKHVTAAI